MTVRKASVSEPVSAQPDELFALITDLRRLHEWNKAINKIVETPDHFVDGSQWVVEMKVMGAKWNSRSTRFECSPELRRFAYVTQTDDGNPSRALWTWSLEPIDGGTEVTVDWELHPRTRFRNVMAAPVRHRQLINEVRRSIKAAEAMIAADHAGARPT